MATAAKTSKNRTTEPPTLPENYTAEDWARVAREKQEREDALFNAQDALRELESRLDAGDTAVTSDELVRARAQVEVCERVLVPVARRLDSKAKIDAAEERALRRYGKPASLVTAERKLAHARRSLDNVRQGGVRAKSRAAGFLADDKNAANSELASQLSAVDAQFIANRISRADGEAGKAKARAAHAAAITAAEAEFQRESTAADERVKAAEATLAKATAALRALTP